jgi:hypothetical protein
MAGEDTRTPEAEQKASSFDGPGPFLAIVRNHLDTEFMGSLEVELLKTSTEGNTTDVSGEMSIVSYLSPFYGITPYAGTSDNEGFDHTQKSYGMWAVPPDIGSTVLVIFAEGNKSRGFWFGCVQEKFMNFMIPGNGSTKSNKTDQTKTLPVGEYNKRNETGVGNQPTTFLKPVNTDAVAQLTRAGLINDQIRGTTTSSARREVPSMVFGMSTPGPLDRRPGKPRVRVGSDNAQTDMPASRLTGSTFVMDDGDPSLFRKGPAATTPSLYASLADGGDPMIPANELVRLRTRTGHQILLHNSEDLIYIAHGSGQSWIELTAQGTIEVYSKGNISFHSDKDINLDAAKDINIKAGANINLIATNQMSTQTGANWDVRVGADGRLTCGGTSNISSAGHYETANPIHMNGPAAATAGLPTAPTTVPAGAGSAASAASQPAPDTFAACVAATGTTPPAGNNPDEADPSDATTTSTPSRTSDGEVAAFNESIGGGPYTLDGRTVNPSTGSTYDDAPLRALRTGSATVTSTPSRDDPLP